MANTSYSNEFCPTGLRDTLWFPRRVGMSLAFLISPLLIYVSNAYGDEVQNLADLIDRRIEARWKSDGVTPAPRTGDAEFLRRVSLHVAGSIPPVADARQFLRDESLDQRRRLVDQLLESPHYITNFSNFWTRVMMPESATDLQGQAQRPLGSNSVGGAPHRGVQSELVD